MHAVNTRTLCIEYKVLQSRVGINLMHFFVTRMLDKVLLLMLSEGFLPKRVIDTHYLKELIDFRDLIRVTIDTLLYFCGFDVT